MLLRLSGRSNPDCASDKILIKLSLKFVEFAFVKKNKVSYFLLCLHHKTSSIKGGLGGGGVFILLFVIL